MKLVALSTAALLAASSAFAGSFVTETPVEDTVETVTQNRGSSAGSAGWVIPVVAVLAIAAAVAASNDDDD